MLKKSTVIIILMFLSVTLNSCHATKNKPITNPDVKSPIPTVQSSHQSTQNITTSAISPDSNQVKNNLNKELLNNFRKALDDYYSNLKNLINCTDGVDEAEEKVKQSFLSLSNSTKSYLYAKDLIGDDKRFYFKNSSKVIDLGDNNILNIDLMELGINEDLQYKKSLLFMKNGKTVFLKSSLQSNFYGIDIYDTYQNSTEKIMYIVSRNTDQEGISYVELNTFHYDQHKREFVEYSLPEMNVPHGWKIIRKTEGIYLIYCNAVKEYRVKNTGIGFVLQTDSNKKIEFVFEGRKCNISQISEEETKENNPKINAFLDKLKGCWFRQDFANNVIQNKSAITGMKNTESRTELYLEIQFYGDKESMCNMSFNGTWDFNQGPGNNTINKINLINDNTADVFAYDSFKNKDITYRITIDTQNQKFNIKFNGNSFDYVGKTDKFEGTSFFVKQMFTGSFTGDKGHSYVFNSDSSALLNGEKYLCNITLNEDVIEFKKGKERIFYYYEFKDEKLYLFEAIENPVGWSKGDLYEVLSANPGNMENAIN